MSEALDEFVARVRERSRPYRRRHVRTVARVSRSDEVAMDGALASVLADVLARHPEWARRVAEVIAERNHIERLATAKPSYWFEDRARPLHLMGAADKRDERARRATVSACSPSTPSQRSA